MNSNANFGSTAMIVLKCIFFWLLKKYTGCTGKQGLLCTPLQLAVTNVFKSVKLAEQVTDF